MAKRPFQKIIGRLVGLSQEHKGLANINVYKQFRRQGNGRTVRWRRLNAAFLICLCGNKHPCYSEAMDLIENTKNDSNLGNVSNFFSYGSSKIFHELSHLAKQDSTFEIRLHRTASLLEKPPQHVDTGATLENIWGIFFPEGVDILKGITERVRALRNRRRIKITKLNSQALTDPGKQVLFTSNIALGSALLPSVAIAICAVKLLLAIITIATNNSFKFFIVIIICFDTTILLFCNFTIYISFKMWFSHLD